MILYIHIIFSCVNSFILMKKIKNYYLGYYHLVIYSIPLKIRKPGILNISNTNDTITIKYFG